MGLSREGYSNSLFPRNGRGNKHCMPGSDHRGISNKNVNRCKVIGSQPNLEILFKAIDYDMN